MTIIALKGWEMISDSRETFTLNGNEYNNDKKEFIYPISFPVNIGLRGAEDRALAIAFEGSQDMTTLFKDMLNMCGNVDVVVDTLNQKRNNYDPSALFKEPFSIVVMGYYDNYDCNLFNGKNDKLQVWPKDKTIGLAKDDVIKVNRFLKIDVEIDPVKLVEMTISTNKLCGGNIQMFQPLTSESFVSDIPREKLRDADLKYDQKIRSYPFSDMEKERTKLEILANVERILGVKQTVTVSNSGGFSS